MKDKYSEPLAIGDFVAYAGSSTGLSVSVSEISHFTDAGNVMIYYPHQTKGDGSKQRIRRSPNEVVKVGV